MSAHPLPQKHGGRAPGIVDDARERSEERGVILADGAEVAQISRVRKALALFGCA
jgi:hypothetical protein